MKNILTTFLVLLLCNVHGALAEEIKEVVTFEKLAKEEVALLLGEHNRVRNHVGVGPLKWSEKISAYSEEWAKHLAESGCTLKHRPTSGKWKQKYGENLFMGTAGFFGVLHTVTTWESEKKVYRYGPLKEKSRISSGHYTQVVWKETKRVGCAKSICNGNVIVVCNYDPTGNIVGEKPF